MHGVLKRVNLHIGQGAGFDFVGGNENARGHRRDTLRHVFVFVNFETEDT